MADELEKKTQDKPDSKPKEEVSQEVNEEADKRANIKEIMSVNVEADTAKSSARKGKGKKRADVACQINNDYARNACRTPQSIQFFRGGIQQPFGKRHSKCKFR